MRVLPTHPRSLGSFSDACFARIGSDYGGLDALIQSTAPSYGVDVNLARSVAAVESCFNPSTASSGAGAVGPMQVLPSTAAAMNSNPLSPPEVRLANVYDTAGNVILGCYYLGQQLTTFGDISQAVAAYNCGPGCVQSRVNSYGGDWANHLPSETKKYLTDVMAYYTALGGSYSGGNGLTNGAAPTSWLDKLTFPIEKWTGLSQTGSIVLMGAVLVLVVMLLTGASRRNPVDAKIKKIKRRYPRRQNVEAVLGRHRREGESDGGETVSEFLDGRKSAKIGEVSFEGKTADAYLTLITPDNSMHDHKYSL